jgi:hypothetical protein
MNSVQVFRNLPSPEKKSSHFQGFKSPDLFAEYRLFNLDCGDKGGAVSPLVGQTLLSVLWICGANTPARPSEE